jgi:hypothetical protein
VNITVKHNGEFIASGWSLALSVFTAFVADLGPGPTTLLAGDMIDGFFGEVPVAELFSGDELATAIGLTAGTSQHSTEPWLKFAIDNKIVYIAKKPYRHSVSWDNIYQAGAVYGTNDNGLYPTGTVKNQLTTVTKGTDSFKVRLPSGGHADPVTRVYTSANTNAGEGSEWNRLMYRIHVDVPDGSQTYDGGPQIGANWAEYTNADIVVGAGDGRASWGQETYNSDTTSRIVRGIGRLSYLQSSTSSVASGDSGWRPLLELVV